MFMFIFIIIHAVGNLHVFLGPDDFNGYGYFYVRLYFTGLGLPMNIVEEYVMVCAVLHVMVALKRTWDINRNYAVSTGKLNLAATGILLLTFMVIHLLQFRFGATQQYLVRPPPYLVNLHLDDILALRLFWSTDKSIEPVAVRDIYKLEFDLFQDPVWVAFYVFSVGVFVCHVYMGWKKLVTASVFKIPKGLQGRVILIGNVIWGFLALCYVSYPLYAWLSPMKQGNLGWQNEKQLEWEHNKQLSMEHKPEKVNGFPNWSEAVGGPKDK
jgi:hypothetical protein